MWCPAAEPLKYPKLISKLGKRNLWLAKSQPYDVLTEPTEQYVDVSIRPIIKRHESMISKPLVINQRTTSSIATVWDTCSN